MLYRKIDENGLFIEDVVLEEQPKIEQNEELIPDPQYITETVPQGFYHPKWNGTEWVEGLSKEEIAELTKPALQEPTLEERLEFMKTQNEIALAELAEVILGGML